MDVERHAGCGCRISCTRVVGAGLAIALLSAGPAPGQPADEDSAAAGARAVAPRLIVELEGGPAWQSRNDAQVPNDETGTRFALDGLTGSGPFAAFRVTAEGRFGGRHGLRLLFAPLSLSGTGEPAQPVSFQGVSFAAGVPTEASYRFDSYRLTYRYRLADRKAWRVDLGLTLKLRDAEIGLSQEDAASSYSNTGLVPLLHVAAAWKPSGRWSLLLDADGAAAAPGRAFDVALKLAYDLSPHWSVEIGYRTLEGGADVDDVYTFAWFHYGVLSAAYRL